MSMGEGQPLIATGPLVSFVPHQISHDSSSVSGTKKRGQSMSKRARVTPKPRDVHKQVRMF